MKFRLVFDDGSAETEAGGVALLIPVEPESFGLLSAELERCTLRSVTFAIEDGDVVMTALHKPVD